MEQIALSDLKMHKEVLEKNLQLVHRAVVTSILALAVSTAALVVAIIALQKQ